MANGPALLTPWPGKAWPVYPACSIFSRPRWTMISRPRPIAAALMLISPVVLSRSLAAAWAVRPDHQARTYFAGKVDGLVRVGTRPKALGAGVADFSAR